MKKKLISLTLVLGILIGLSTSWITTPRTVSAETQTFVEPHHTKASDRRVFLNASQNVNGNTSTLAKNLFGNLTYKQVNLASYNIPQIGQGDGDFNKVWDQLKDADVIVIGTPVYWSNMSGYLKTFIDHLQISNDLANRDLYMIVQGSDANQSLAINSVYGTMNRVAIRFNMNFVGIGQTTEQINQLHNKMIGNSTGAPSNPPAPNKPNTPNKPTAPNKPNTPNNWTITNQRGVGRVYYTPGYSINVWTSPDETNFTKKIKHGTSWKYFKIAKKGNKTMYNFGGNQWVDGAYFR